MSGDILHSLLTGGQGWVDVRDFVPRIGPSVAAPRSISHSTLGHDGDLLYVQINTVGDSKDETLAHFCSASS